MRWAATASRSRSPTSSVRVEVRAGEQHDELLAADAVDEVERPQRLSHRVGDVLEHGVAGRVAVLVVDPLEVVEVGHEQPERRVLARGRRAARAPRSG